MLKIIIIYYILLRYLRKFRKGSQGNYLKFKHAIKKITFNDASYFTKYSWYRPNIANEIKHPSSLRLNYHNIYAFNTKLWKEIYKNSIKELLKLKYFFKIAKNKKI